MAKSDTPSYQELSDQLETFTAKLQDPDVAVDAAARYYEEAMKLITQLESLLEHAENRIHEIRAQFGEGK